MRPERGKLAVLAVVLMMLTVVLASAVPEQSDAVNSGDGYYKYVLNYTGEKINSVDVYTSSTGDPTNITEAKSSIWNFDDTTGYGPFNSYYAAVNYNDGTIAFKLKPSDLTKKIDGEGYTMGDYNIVWVIPTVYWKSDDTHLWLTNSPGDDSEYKAYAHTVITSTSPLTKKVYPYIGIGVYEGSTQTIGDKTALMSKTARPPTTEQTVGTIDGYAQNTPGDAILWNFYHWTFTKMATYMVGMGKNTQQIWGSGNVSSGARSITGSGNGDGPYVSGKTTYSKVFIENTWGSIYEWVGSTNFSNTTLYLTQTTGGISNYSNPIGSSMGVSLPGSNEWITGTSKAPATWDLPISAGSDNHSDPNYPGDKSNSATGVRALNVGGNYSNGNIAGIAYLNGQDDSSRKPVSVGGRLAYFFDNTEVTVTAVSNEAEYGQVNWTSVEAIIVDKGVTASVNKNTIILGGETLTATPGPDYKFLGWRTDAGFIATEEFTINADTEIVAVFGHSDSYVYSMNYTGEEILSVDVYKGSGTYTHVTNAQNSIWNFNTTTGIGPFNSYYAAIEVSSGAPAFRLNPNNLSQKLDASPYTMNGYNIVWMIPTVYWTVIGDSLILSDVSTEGTAYAHTVTLPSEKVYPCIGIGVYEASTYTDDQNVTYLMSRSDKDPTVDQTIVAFDSYAQNTPGDTILWNYYQWTFTKMATYMVGMGKNTQNIWGMGNTTSNTIYKTGLGDSAGPYVTTSDTHYSKVFIENSWGSVFEFVGDTVFSSGVLYAGQNASEISYTTSDKSSGSSIPTESGWITASSKNAMDWDLPISSDKDHDYYADEDVYSGDYIGVANYLQVLRVGGHKDDGYYGKHAGVADMNTGLKLDETRSNTGARLAYFFELYEVSVDQDPNGTTTPTVTKYSFGDKVEFLNVSDEGYRLKDVVVYKKGDPSTTVELDTKTLDSGTFTMPGYNVVIKPVYDAVKTLTITSGGHGSVDVTTSDVPITGPINVIGSSTLTVTKDGDQSGTMVIIDNPYIETERVEYTITATPANLHPFRGFFKGDTSDEIYPSSPSTVEAAITGDDAAATIMAKFNAYVASFDMKGHGTQIPSQDILIGGTVSEPSSPSEKNYMFRGWFSDSSTTRAWDFSTRVYSDVTLYALWEVQTHQPTGVTLNFETVGGGSVSPSKISVPLGAVITVDGDKLKIVNGSSVQIVKAEPEDGYAVQSWSLPEDVAVSDALVKVTFKKMDIASISVYIAPFKVSYVPGEFFDPNGMTVALQFTDQTEQLLQYRGNESLFSFSPSLDEPLKMSDKYVTITYKDVTVQQEISVKDASPGFDWTIVMLAGIVIAVIIAILALSFGRPHTRTFE